MAKKRKKKAAKRKRPHQGNAALASIATLAYKGLPYILIIAAVLFTAKVTLSFLLNSSYFKIKKIEILSNESTNASSVILKKLETRKGNNIFRADIKICEAAIEKACPEIKAVVVQRVLPNALSVTYKIRKPVCQVDSGYYYLISDDLTVLPNAQITQEPNLIIVTGIRISKRTRKPTKQGYEDGLRRAVSIIKEINDTDFSDHYQEVVKINVYDKNNPALYLKDRTKVELGEFSFKEKEPLLKEIIDELESKDKKARVIDLRFEDVVVIPR